MSAAAESGDEGISPGTHTLVTRQESSHDLSKPRILEPRSAWHRRWRWPLVPAFAASEAGGAAPLSYFLGFVWDLCVSVFVVIKFTRRYVAAGVGFTYVRVAFGIPAGFTAGWVYRKRLDVRASRSAVLLPLLARRPLFSAAQRLRLVARVLHTLDSHLRWNQLHRDQAFGAAGSRVTPRLASMAALAIILATSEIVLGKGGARTTLASRPSTRTTPPKAGAASGMA